ncbi:MAG TPA: hypothetical protein VFH55_11570 [Nitrospiria bacterium]|nr:hypothetical protein [Nitrospiria bacterium]
MQNPMRLSRWLISIVFLVVLVMSRSIGAEVAKFGTPKGEEGTRIFQATEHPHYSGQFHITGQHATLVGHVQDPSPWDHLDYAGKHLTSVPGTIDINVDERSNTGRVVAEFSTEKPRALSWGSPNKTSENTP